MFFSEVTSHELAELVLEETELGDADILPLDDSEAAIVLSALDPFQRLPRARAVELKLLLKR